MVEREHFTNGSSWSFATEVALMGTEFTAHIGNWQHWIAIGFGYGSGVVLVLSAAVFTAKCYYSH